MNSREKGFLLLSSHLGNPDRKIMSAHQLRVLADRMRQMKEPEQDRDLELSDLIAMGYRRDTAGQILSLLNEDALLEHYLRRGRQAGCIPVTRVSESYPLILRKRLGPDSPGCLWAKGDLSVLNTPAISLVGSRDLLEPNRKFAAEVGRQAAMQGLTLVSGNARGADKTAQNSCLEAGGRVISVVADSLNEHKTMPNMLYLSENSFDEAFSSQRAISRNRVIHALGRMVFVAQCGLGKGGTWDGTVKNLRFGWSPVACFRDGCEATKQLEQMGAYLVDSKDLADYCGLLEEPITLF